MPKKIIDGNLQVKGSVEEDIITQIECITYYDEGEDENIVKVYFLFLFSIIFPSLLLTLPIFPCC